MLEVSPALLRELCSLWSWAWVPSHGTQVWQVLWPHLCHAASEHWEVLGFTLEPISSWLFCFAVAASSSS